MRKWLRNVWPVALLLAFAVVNRVVPRRASLEVSGIDCNRVLASDLDLLERCVALHPDDVELITDLGKAYEGAGQPERAEAIYRRALAVDPADGDVHLRLGLRLLGRGDLSGARAEGVAALKVHVGNAAAAELVKRASSPEGAR